MDDKDDPDSIEIGEDSISTLSEEGNEELLRFSDVISDYDELETSMPIEEDPEDDDDVESHMDGWVGVLPSTFSYLLLRHLS